MNGETMNWTGGRHRFFLRLGELRALQKVCGVGPMQIFVRLAGHQWLVDDVIETIVLGLVGSGEMNERDAREFVDRTIFQQEKINILQFVPLAAEIIRSSCMVETEEEEPDEGKPEAGKTVPATST